MPRILVAALFIGAATILPLPGSSVSAQPALRVCADPDYMPYSNRAGQGFENKIAETLAHALGMHVEYTWASTRGRGGFDQFLHDTLNAHKCDVVIDVPYASDNILATKPYYVSSYVFVFPKKKNYDITSMDSPVLKQLRIGFEADTPAENGLKIRALILHATPFEVGDSPGESPESVLNAVSSGKVAVAVTWEPSIGYYLRSHNDLRVVAVPNSRSTGTPEQYAFPMAIGARKGDTHTRDMLDAALAKSKPQVTRILDAYGVRLYQPTTDQVGAVP